jgi:hypothetical protein
MVEKQGGFRPQHTADATPNTRPEA